MAQLFTARTIRSAGPKTASYNSREAAARSIADGGVEVVVATTGAVATGGALGLLIVTI